MTESRTPERRSSSPGASRGSASPTRRGPSGCCGTPSAAPGRPGDDLLDALGGTADPDLALDGLLRLLASAAEAGEADELRAALAAEPGTRSGSPPSSA